MSLYENDEILTDFNILQPKELKKYHGKRDTVMKALKVMDFTPNTNQFTMASIIAARLGGKKRLLLSVPPGQGKSRIIAALATMVDLKFTTFKVVYTHDSLLERERGVF